MLMYLHTYPIYTQNPFAGWTGNSTDSDQIAHFDF